MTTTRILYFYLALSVAYSCSAQMNNTSSSATETERPIAFPGAEGFGKYSSGGRGGKVFIVTNLEDHGAGSFRDAVNHKEPRIIVFAISGTIHLQTELSIQGDVTIAGQTAPGDGICIADQPVNLAGNNIIIRYMRFRLGDKYQNKGMVPGSGHDDAFGGTRKKNIIIDHCSISWSNDECISIYRGDSTTIQWSLISEPLNYSYHFEEGDKDFEKHGYGGIWGGQHLSAHHNLFAHCISRTPRFNGTRNDTAMEFVDYRNNVIYNWGGNNVYGGEGGQYNIVNNYYKSGPSTSKNVLSRIVNPTKTETVGYGKFFVDGNYVEGFEEVSKKNFLGVDMGNGGSNSDKKNAVIAVAFNTVSIPEQSAKDAYLDLLAKVGASYRRDTLDQRIIKDVWNKTGGFIDVQGNYPHGTAYEKTVTAWPFLKSLPAPTDTDKDGIPDAWENKYGLNPNDPADATTKSLHVFYTNIEMYLNSILTK